MRCELCLWDELARGTCWRAGLSAVHESAHLSGRVAELIRSPTCSESGTASQLRMWFGCHAKVGSWSNLTVRLRTRTVSIWAASHHVDRLLKDVRRERRRRLDDDERMARTSDDARPSPSHSVVVTRDSVVRRSPTADVEETRAEAYPAAAVASNATSYTLYLVRHGEAEHNVKERLAQEAAAEEAITRGFDANSSEVKIAMETARKAALQDSSLCDPPLSAAGKAAATDTRRAIDELVHGLGLPPPCGVLVSPLSRTLQTAALIFPDHEKSCVRACEELRERRTGLPCDTRSRAELLCQRATFKSITLDDIVDLDRGLVEDSGSSCGGRSSSVSSVSDGEPIEDLAMLRRRTLQVLKLLERCEHRAVALVTHKGYLRELERGPFCRPDATEFGNSEVRVYTVMISHEGDGDRRVTAERLHPL